MRSAGGQLCLEFDDRRALRACMEGLHTGRVACMYAWGYGGLLPSGPPPSSPLTCTPAVLIMSTLC